MSIAELKVIAHSVSIRTPALSVAVQQAGTNSHCFAITIALNGKEITADSGPFPYVKGLILGTSRTLETIRHAV